MTGRRDRGTAVLVLAALFVLALGLSALTPLLPRFVERFDLTTVEASALSSVLTVVMLVGSVPLGLAVDRVGARGIALAAVAAIAVGALLHGLAASYPMLLAGRAVLGLADTMLWAGGFVWLTHLDLSPRLRAAALGASTTVMGAGFAVGPVVVGLTAERLGLAVPFTAVAVLAAALAVLLARAPAPPPGAGSERPRLGETVRAARADTAVSAALLLLVVSGGMMFCFSFLIPLELGRNGLSAGQIGAVFTVSGALSVSTGLVVNHLGERAVRPLLGAVCVGWLGLVALVPASSSSTPALLAFLGLAGWASTTMMTISYPLGALGALRAGIARGAVVGGLNAAWALSATVAPLAGGAIAQSAGFRVAWLVVACVEVAGALAVVRLVRRSTGETLPGPRRWRSQASRRCA